MSMPQSAPPRQKFSHCKLRVFFLCSKQEELDMETRAMVSLPTILPLLPQVSLLTKFRIEADDVIIIPDATR